MSEASCRLHLFTTSPQNTLPPHADKPLDHPDNERFVSSARSGSWGPHVPSVLGVYVITRLGRDADLILRQGNSRYPVLGVHVIFEISPATELINLSVRSKPISSVRLAMLESKGTEDTAEIIDNSSKEQTIGDSVVLYGGKSIGSSLRPTLFVCSGRAATSSL
ncbi:hypothetical protein FHL15_011153 [Xylaria flabelliformis]|uniref:Uncharacterized protein n=1 Tax=Xylaria flabelliformis TaxID=2512241 RepID=A0A553HJ16_9PEZI|nr:hypothetical protein FHL15_011153 [Xylaria flabelliformis]